MSERDELAPPYLVGVTDAFPGGNDDDLVEWAFEAGIRYQEWHSEPRSITTAEELDDVAVLTVIRSADGVVYEWYAGSWQETGVRDGRTSADIALPATVLYEPRA